MLMDVRLTDYLYILVTILLLFFDVKNTECGCFGIKKPFAENYNTIKPNLHIIFELAVICCVIGRMYKCRFNYFFPIVS